MTYDEVVARTNIDIDKALIGRVMDRHGFATMRDAVDAGLRKLDTGKSAKEAMLALEGIGWGWDDDDPKEDAPEELGTG